MSQGSKDFDTTLSAAIDVAATAAHTPGAQAARIKGRKRTVRKRIVLSTASFVIIAIGASAAFRAASSSGGQPSSDTTPHPTTATSPVHPTLPPTNTAGTPTTSSTPHTTSGTTGGTTNPTGSQNSTPGSPPGPAAPSWLSPAQVPFAGLMDWTSGGSPVHCTGSELFLDLYSPTDCSMHNRPGAPHAASKMDVQLYQSNGVPVQKKGAWLPPVAAQEFFTYPSAADAQSAYEAITVTLLAEDPGLAGAQDPLTHRPVVSTTTISAQTAHGMATEHKLRDDDGVPAEVNGNYSEQSDLHFYFAVKDKVMEVLEIKGGSAIGDTSQDAAVLQTVIGALG
ncbi:hypothetical protein [Catenulispora rubra]|uniref:hypothetical protein n=1 Tax=Catenulispora rubra TaxID=280293 RepID=UPI00189262B1|nr:hypothetical protein [Catenulispora rubra]